MSAKFQAAEWGSMEYSDYVKVELAPCKDGKCESFATTKLLRDDFGGWSWKTGKWLGTLDYHHTQIKLRVTLHSTSNYAERHILDNLEVVGWGCSK
jgi:hypothetical protein